MPRARAAGARRLRFVRRPASRARTRGAGQSNMEYPIGSPTCWDENNTNCANRKEAQCNFGCVNRSGVEIKGMAAYDKGMRLMIDEGFHRGYKDPAPDLFGTTGWLPPSKMGGKFSATCWFYGQYLSSPPTPPHPPHASSQADARGCHCASTGWFRFYERGKGVGSKW